jgi:hypothetical protein
VSGAINGICIRAARVRQSTVTPLALIGSAHFSISLLLIREMTRQIGDVYFQDGEAVMFADSLDAAVRRIAGLPPRVA